MSHKEGKYPNRVREIRKAFMGKIAELAEVLNMTSTGLSYIERGINKLTPENAELIEEYYGLPKGSCFNTAQLVVPMVGYIDADGPIFSEKNFDGYASMYNANNYKFGEIIGIVVQGDSMEDEIIAGDIAIIELSDEVANGHIGAFVLNNKQTLKIYRQKQSGIELHSINLNYEPIIVSEGDNFRVIGELVNIQRYYNTRRFDVK